MSEEQEEFKKALKQIAGYLSRRSHSEKELVLKLSKQFSSNIVDKALEKARQNHWLENTEELAEKTAESLHKKNKSWSYIKKYLVEKDLPLPPYDKERELAKAKNLLLKKQGFLNNLSYEEKINLKQFLSYRGFEEGIVQELLS